MKTIRERAEKAYRISQYKSNHNIAKTSFESGYIQGAIEQKAIDDIKLFKLKSTWEKEAQTNHDVVEKACEAYENELRRLERLLDESVDVPANLMSSDETL